MKTITKKISGFPELPGEGTVFLDIETTGFSPEYNPVYLIGACHAQEGSLFFLQWFAESQAEEAGILAAAAEYLLSFPEVVTFNGNTFDLPYLQKRAALHHMENAFIFPKRLDLLQTVRPLKQLLGLPDCRQKTIEAFLGLCREDTASGGELIPIYHRYALAPSEDLERLLLLHNEEDVLAMPRLLPILSYEALAAGRFCVEEIVHTGPESGPGAVSPVFSAVLRLDLAVPVPLFLEQDGLRLTIRDEFARLSAALFHGELRLFFRDYKNYYYLPVEDMAVHKSVACFVEKDFREQASRDTAYQRREGDFLPLPSGMDVPHPFRKDRLSRPFLLLTELSGDVDFWSSYLAAFFRQAVQNP